MTTDYSKHAQLNYLQFLTAIVLFIFYDIHSAIQDLFNTLICITVSTLLFHLYAICIYFQPFLLLFTYFSAHARRCLYLWNEYRRFNWISRRMLADILCDIRVVLKMTTREIFYFKGHSFSGYMCRTCARIVQWI
jgi:hypothetical protein